MASEATKMAARVQGWGGTAIQERHFLKFHPLWGTGSGADQALENPGTDQDRHSPDELKVPVPEWKAFLQKTVCFLPLIAK